MKTKIAVFAFIAASAALAQTTPAFEVAVIKPATSEQLSAARRAGQKPHTEVTVGNNRLDMGYQSLMAIISRAYDVVPAQIAGPDSLNADHYDILAKLPAGATEGQVPQMLQSLLADRFGLKMHREKRETGIYALVVSKSGLNPTKMKPATAPELTPEPQPGDRTISTPFGKITLLRTAENVMVGFMPGMGIVKEPLGTTELHMEFSNLTTPRFAQFLSSAEDRLVVDKTGLTGSYEAVFELSLPQPQPPGGAEAGGAATASAPQLNPSLKAVEQMGLKLEPQKDLVEMIVIDHIEKTPTAN